MASTNLQTLVLCGVTVNGDVLTGRTGIGSAVAMSQAPATPSYPRHRSPCSPRTVYEPGLRLIPVEILDADQAADRAGRPGSRAGVLSRRCAGGPRRTAAWCPGCVLARTRASVGNALPGRLPALRGWFFRADPFNGSRARGIGNTRKTGLARLKPVQGMPVAATWGKTAR